MAPSPDEGPPAALNAPPLSALFLIHFDLKVGYTIAWKRALPGVELDGVVEYKSLPSGLHNIKEDLVYFVHREYAGLSAFVSRTASEAERNAHLIAVGILVPLSLGRLGRCWLHARELQDLARRLVPDIKQTRPLEVFWDMFHAKQPDLIPDADSALPSPLLERRLGASTNGFNGREPHEAFQLPPMHPARSILHYLDTLGPLLFPLHRAALLRKRILLVTQAPVRPACEFVYDLTLLSSIPSSIQEHLPLDSEPYFRLRPSFCIGVHDIPQLEDAVKANDSPDGWAACTTDEILIQKSSLLDVVVELRPYQQDQDKRWPSIRTSTGIEIKATQRDLRRYRALKRVLQRIKEAHSQYYTDEDRNGAGVQDDDDYTPLLARLTHEPPPENGDEHLGEVVEPTSWTALAYDGFMWWASAGERDAAAEEERQDDRDLLCDLEALAEIEQYQDEPPTSGSESNGESGPPPGGVEMAVVAYFHRLTANLVSALAEAVDGSDDSDSDGKVVIGFEELRRMGVDSWSESSRVFALEMVAKYWNREADVRGNSIECCGVRII